MQKQTSSYVHAIRERERHATFYLRKWDGSLRFHADEQHLSFELSAISLYPDPRDEMTNLYQRDRERDCWRTMYIM